MKTCAQYGKALPEAPALGILSSQASVRSVQPEMAEADAAGRVQNVQKTLTIAGTPAQWRRMDHCLLRVHAIEITISRHKSWHALTLELQERERS